MLTYACCDNCLDFGLFTQSLDSPLRDDDIILLRVPHWELLPDFINAVYPLAELPLRHRMLLQQLVDACKYSQLSTADNYCWQPSQCTSSQLSSGITARGLNADVRGLMMCRGPMQAYIRLNFLFENMSCEGGITTSRLQAIAAGSNPAQLGLMLSCHIAHA